MTRGRRFSWAVAAVATALAFGIGSAAEAAVVRARGTMVKGKKMVAVNGKRFLIVRKTRMVVDDTKAVNDRGLRNGMMVLVKGRSAIGARTAVADAIQAQDELQGRITALNAAGAPPSFTVLAQKVCVDDLTVFANVPPPGGLAGLALDQFVEVHGLRDEAGNVRASRVEVKAGAGEVETESAELKGEIGAFDGTAQTFTVGTQLVNFAGASVFPAGAVLANGQLVEVEGNTDLGGTLVATRVEREDLEDEIFDPRTGQKTRIEGYVAGLVTNADGTFAFTVGETTVQTLPGTQFRRGAVEDLTDGVLVEVEGASSGTALLAREVSFERNRVRLDAVAGTAAPTSVGLFGLSIAVNELTDLDQATLPLAAGSRFQVRGFRDSAGNLIAEEVRDSNAGRDILQGQVEVRSPDALGILGVTIDISGAGMEFRGDRDQVITRGAFMSLLRKGTVVKARGAFTGGVFVADEAEIEI